jgi:hypothetical protein
MMKTQLLDYGTIDEIKAEFTTLKEAFRALRLREHISKPTFYRIMAGEAAKPGIILLIKTNWMCYIHHMLTDAQIKEGLGMMRQFIEQKHMIQITDANFARDVLRYLLKQETE